MSSPKLNLFRQSLVLGVAVLLGLSGFTAHAATITSADFASIPPTNVVNTTNSTPLVMLLLGKDDALYKKAYTDLVHLTGTGSLPNTTYTDSFAYYGYFNSDMCYLYDTTNGYFVPKAATKSGTHYCDSTAAKYWSGNFLNWATMTRIDILRKVLYGGYRSTDTSSQTILQRAYFPPDGHSFAKVYSRSDMDELTPYSQSKYGTITICNTTDVAGTGLYDSATQGTAGTKVLSQNVTAPPLMRVAAGDFSKWAANERWQCTWAGEKTDDPVTANSPNNNDPSETLTSTTSASGTTTYLGGLQNSNNSDAGPDYHVRVEVCDSVDQTASYCTKYPKGDYKPTGLLQSYGETGKIKFGLMTGSYTLSKSGGVLRKNISDFSDEVNSATYGTFTNVNGIVSTINALRMHGYDYNSGLGSNGKSDHLAGSYNTYDDCSWGLNSFTEPACSNWGNPMSEMYLEAVRYFHDDSASTAFSTDDSSYLPSITGTNDIGLSTATWPDPSTNPVLNKDNWCAKCSIIVLNTGPFSYDSDQLGGFSDLTSAITAAQETDKIGTWEGITGNKYFVGHVVGGTNTGDQNNLCTPKIINDLSTAIGPCPDEPRLSGSFDMAGIAYWAHTNNVNPHAPTGHVQTINTYTVNLSSTTPIVNIPVPGNTSQIVKLMPACQDAWGSSKTAAATTDTAGECRIIDMEITKPYTLDASGTSASGTIYVNWEDSEQGGDFDQDMRGTIDYTITGTTIEVITKVNYDSTGYRMGFGYVISGTTDDGFHVHSGINNYQYDPPSVAVADTSLPPNPPNPLNCSTACNVNADATGYIYTLSSTTTAGTLKDPLWYTAKYGGFLDLNTNHTINTTSSAQWDNRNNATGSYGADGVPDNYFTSVDPGQLETNLSKVFENITERVSSGSAAAVISNAGTGTGMLAQALYQPVVTNSANTSQRVTWVGMLHSLFIDQYGNLREDGNQNGKLDDYTTDPVVSLFYDPTVGQTELATYTTTDGINLTLNSVEPLSDLKPIWSARDQLAALNNSDIKNQRSYSTTIDPTHGRYIFTAIDSNNDGVINNADVIPFTDTAIDSSNYGWLDIQSDLSNDGTTGDLADAQDLVDFIRGEDGLDKFRSRTIDYDQDNTDEVWRLGDIVHSTPLIVGPPSDDWDSKFGDSTYTTFRSDYADRRVVVYAGANDGMLHAFNGGFFDPINKQYDLTRAINTSINETVAPPSDPLGSELWAYVPSNLLPHLQWLTEPDYPHVYYVDGSPQAFDVNIFGSSGNSIGYNDGMDHPNGWGTILVVGMRLGGAPITYTPVSGRTVTSRSAYIIMDITDPEKPPVLLGEISDPSGINGSSLPSQALGFTTSEPSLIVKRTPGTGGDWSNPDTNEWYLVFGSGPTQLSNVTSTQDAGLYILNLKTMSFVSGFDPEVLHDSGGNVLANSFVGDTSSVDWTNDFNTDASYFGIVGGGTGVSPSSAPTGRLMRMVTYTNTPSNWLASTVINPSQPFANRPVATIDDLGKWWIYAGTGRLFVGTDNQSTNQQSFYGIKEQVDSTTGLPSDTSLATRDTGAYPLQNTTGVKVYANGSLTDTQGVLPSGVTTFTSLENEIEGMAGWYINFSTPSTGSTRNLGPATLFSQLTLFTSYTPSGDSCLAEGTSDLYAVYYKTGTAYPNAGLGNDTTDTITVNNASVPLTKTSTSEGQGEITQTVMIGGAGGTTKALGCSSNGSCPPLPVNAVTTPNGRQSWREIITQ